MDCCASMSCPSHADGDGDQECCRTMPDIHAPFMQSASTPVASLSPAVFTASQGITHLNIPGWVDATIQAYCHAPPDAGPPANLPLRI